MVVAPLIPTQKAGIRALGSWEGLAVPATQRGGHFLRRRKRSGPKIGLCGRVVLRRLLLGSRGSTGLGKGRFSKSSGVVERARKMAQGLTRTGGKSGVIAGRRAPGTRKIQPRRAPLHRHCGAKVVQASSPRRNLSSNHQQAEPEVLTCCFP